MFREDGNRPSDQRGFLHKKLLGLGVGLARRIPGVGTAIGIGQDVVRTLTRQPSRRVIPRELTARPSIRGEQEKAMGRDLKFGPFDSLALTTTRKRRQDFRPLGIGGGRNGERNGEMRAGPCDFPMVRDRQGRCRTPTSGEFGGEQFGVGEAVMGRYGAALEPGSQIIDRAICLRGMQLGDDGLCYNKGQITNKQRMWPRGRKPLLTGGEMRAIGIASRAGRRVDATAKRLRELGMMKQLPRTKSKPHAHAKAATGVVSV